MAETTGNVPRARREAHPVRFDAGAGSAAGVFRALIGILALGGFFGAAAGAHAQGAMMTLTSDAFQNGGTIPAIYGCRDNDSSPELSWSGVPQSARSLAILVEDPDAPGGIWVHWVIFNIPPTLPGLPAAVPPGSRLPNGAEQGIGSSGDNRFHGPCPPSGTHRYYFRLFALDAVLDAGPSTNRQALLSAMNGHIVAQAELMGRFSH
jgi:Raf kinase inhibitor-like YbhB/YbcL family protein